MKNINLSKLHWFVYCDRSSGSIEPYDVFKNGRFIENVKDALKSCPTKDLFGIELDRAAMCSFWSKCEYEIVLASWPYGVSKSSLEKATKEMEDYALRWGHYPIRVGIDLEVAEKIDIYDQLHLNWDRFVDYVWTVKEESDK